MLIDPFELAPQPDRMIEKRIIAKLKYLLFIIIPIDIVFSVKADEGSQAYSS